MTKIQSEVKPSWVGIIYSPQLESVFPSTAASLLNAPTPQRQKCYPIHIGLPFEKLSSSKEGGMLGTSESRTIFLQPGTSLGISAKDWADAQTMPGFKFVENKLKAGIIQVLEPSIIDDLEPGYRHFDEGNALKLVRATLHEEWIDTWLIAEERKSILVAAAAQRSELVKIKEVLQAG